MFVIEFFLRDEWNIEVVFVYNSYIRCRGSENFFTQNLSQISSLPVKF